MKTDKKIINGIPQIFLVAEKGMVVTDGDATYGSVVRIANGVSEDAFYEITEEEYERILDEKTNELETI